MDTFSASEIDIKKIMDYFQKDKKPSPTPYIVFFAQTKDYTINIYRTKKIVISGSNTSLVLNFLKKNNIYSTKKDDLPTVFFDAMGSDEVGTGALFGPITVCACYVDKELKNKLSSFKIQDSKTITDTYIRQIAPKIAEIVPYSVMCLDNYKFNELTKKGYNMNKIKAILHNGAYLALSKKLKFTPKAVIDEFCTSKSYFQYLADEPKVHKDIIFKTKGESYHIAVAAASILARYKFLEKMADIENKVGFKIDYGAGFKADEDLLKIYQKYGIDFLYEITKMNFNNVKKLNIE